MIVRKPYLRASEIMQQRVKNKENIEILFETNTLGLFGENGVEGAHLVRHKGEANEEKFDISIDGFFLAIGHKPNTDLFKGQIRSRRAGLHQSSARYCHHQHSGCFRSRRCGRPISTARVLLPQARKAKAPSKPTDSCSNSKNYSIKSYKAGLI